MHGTLEVNPDFCNCALVSQTLHMVFLMLQKAAIFASQIALRHGAQLRKADNDMIFNTNPTGKKVQ
jgi:hypothetical protein